MRCPEHQVIYGLILLVEHPERSPSPTYVGECPLILSQEEVFTSRQVGDLQPGSPAIATVQLVQGLVLRCTRLVITLLYHAKTATSPEHMLPHALRKHDGGPLRKPPDASWVWLAAWLVHLQQAQPMTVRDVRLR